MANCTPLTTDVGFSRSLQRNRAVYRETIHFLQTEVKRLISRGCPKCYGVYSFIVLSDANMGNVSDAFFLWRVFLLPVELLAGTDGVPERGNSRRAKEYVGYQR